MRFLLKIANNSSGGVILLTSMILSALCAMIAMLFFASNMRSAFSPKLSTYRDSAYFIQTQVEQAFKNDVAWNLTMSDAANDMSCLTAATTCVDTPKPLKLLDNTGATIVGSGTPTWFDMKGNVCAAADGCPYQYTLIWRPICPLEGPCDTSTVEVRGTLNFTAPPEIPAGLLNTSKFNLVYIR